MRLSLGVRSPLPEFVLDVSRLEVRGVVGLVGPSGAGKSTLLECVAGLRRPVEGRILAGAHTWFDSDADICLAPGRRRVGYVPQDLALFPHLSARANIAWGASGRAVGRRRTADELIDRFGLSGVAGRSAGTLSGGERQRVALARALASEPVALLLDEPFSGLDAEARVAAADLVAQTCAELDLPTLLVSHDFDDVARVADAVAVLEAGGISQIGSPDQIAGTPCSHFAAALAGVNAFAGIASPGGGDLTHIRWEGAGTLLSRDSVAGEVLASVHPADLNLVPAEPDGMLNALPGRVLTRSPRGARMRLEIDVGRVLVAEVAQAATAALPGEAIWVTWKPEAMRLAAL